MSDGSGGSSPSLARDGEVLILSLGSGENRLSPGWLKKVGDLLDEVEAWQDPRALVTTATGKFWSNGLDLAAMAEMSRPQSGAFVTDVNGLFARVLTLPLPTVAALQGHAFAAGAMLAIAHDMRVMRSDRGFICFPEVDIGMVFNAGMTCLIQAKLCPAVAHEAMTTGRRYAGPAALSANLANSAVVEEDLLGTAVELARSLAPKSSPALGAIKRQMYWQVTAALRQDAPAPDLPRAS
ncbi:MAG: enoyl-CoA hydratase/isomerase family protein [Candidatus Dormibacteraeota bacterium]|nr:enoyl-CoA hydratase/isomerase family protein [Candidatus Dormibacteraeota bacterium]